MGEKSKKSSRSNELVSTDAVDTASAPQHKMKRKEYEREMRILQGELVAMQEWVKATGARVCVVFEGVDSAGKGGTIRRITERTSPRVFKHIALPAPPSAGQVADVHPALHGALSRRPARSPSSTAAGTTAPASSPSWATAPRSRPSGSSRWCPQVEKAMVDDGIILIKYFLNVSRDEQTRRLENRIDDPRKIWKLSPTDLKSYSRRYDYCRARDAMLAATTRRGRRGTSWTTTTRSAAG